MCASWPAVAKRGSNTIVISPSFIDQRLSSVYFDFDPHRKQRRAQAKQRWWHNAFKHQFTFITVNVTVFECAFESGLRHTDAPKITMIKTELLEKKLDIKLRWTDFRWEPHMIPRMIMKFFSLLLLFTTVLVRRHCSTVPGFLFCREWKMHAYS